MKLPAFIESLPISLYWVKILQFFLCIFTLNRSSLTKKIKLGCFFIRVVSLYGNFSFLYKRNFYLHLTYTCSNQSPQRNHKNKTWWGTHNVFRLIQRRIQNPVKHLRWNFLRKQLTTFCYYKIIYTCFYYYFEQVNVG